MILKLLCKLPAWIGGGHRWRRPTKKEHDKYVSDWKREPLNVRICRRCGAERPVKARKAKVTA